MSEETHAEEHSSPIKTPKQLIVVVVLAFVIPIALFGMLAHLMVSRSDFGDRSALSEEAIARRLKPVGEVAIADPNAPQVAKSGKEIVDAVCAACHVTGALNAPKIGDKTAWQKLIKEGHDNLTREAIKGVRQMPPRGGNPELSDVEIARAVAYMANQSGASFKEPEAKPAPGAQPAASGPAAGKPAPTQAAAAPAAAAAKSGQAIYDATCTACHAAGVAGAPKVGDKAAWAPRIKEGMNVLYANSIKGKNAMPPKGGNPSLSDAEVNAAVDYMVKLSK
jgi:cytochrome c5